MHQGKTMMREFNRYWDMHLVPHGDRSYGEPEIDDIWANAVDWSEFLEKLKNVDPEFAVRSKAWGTFAKCENWELVRIQTEEVHKKTSEYLGHITIEDTTKTLRVKFPYQIKFLFREPDVIFCRFIDDEMRTPPFNMYQAKYLATVEGEFKLRFDVVEPEQVFSGSFDVWSYDMFTYFVGTKTAVFPGETTT